MSSQPDQWQARIREALELGLQAWRTTTHRDTFMAAFDDLDALSRAANTLRERIHTAYETADPEPAQWLGELAALTGHPDAVDLFAPAWSASPARPAKDTTDE